MSQGSGYGYGGSPVGVGAMLGQRINPLFGGPGTALNINQVGGGAGMSSAQLPSESGGEGGVNPALAGGLLGMIGQEQQGQQPTPSPDAQGDGPTYFQRMGDAPQAGALDPQQFNTFEQLKAKGMDPASYIKGFNPAMLFGGGGM